MLRHVSIGLLGLAAAFLSAGDLFAQGSGFGGAMLGGSGGGGGNSMGGSSGGGFGTRASAARWAARAAAAV